MMNDSTPIVTPTRTAKDAIQCFDIDHNYLEEVKGISEHITTENGMDTKQSYQDFKDIARDNKKSFNTSQRSSKKGAKERSNIELLTGMTPSKILKSAKKPVLLQKKSTKSPLNGKRSNKNKSSKMNGRGNLEKVFSEDPNVEDCNQLAIGADSVQENNTEKIPYTEKNSITSNYDLIHQVDEGKEDIHAKKQRLRDLENEIVSISDKMTSYKEETDEIIEDLKQRIVEREENNKKIKEEPMFCTVDGDHDIKSSEEYTSSDDLINLLKSGVNKKNKKFLESCREDLKAWKSIVGKEVEAFNQFLQHKHKTLHKGKLFCNNV